MRENQPSPSLTRINPSDDPLETFENMRARSGEVYWDEESSAWCVLSHNAVRAVLDAPETFGSQHLESSAEPVLGARALAQITGAEHDNKKATALRAMARVAMDRYYLPTVEKTADNLWNAQRGKSRFDLVEAISEPFSIDVTCKLIGLDPQQSHRFLPWNRSVVAFITAIHRDDKDAARQLRDAALFRAFIQKLVRARARSPRHDLVSYLATEGSKANFSAEEIVALIMNIFLAASEPLGKTLCYATFELLRSPEILAQARQDAGTLSATVAETLRLHAPVQIIPRIVNHGTTLAGHDLKPGEVVYCLIGAANRDPEVFPDPSSFSPSRPELNVKSAFAPSSRHLSFGSGTHFCIGAMLAKRQLEAGLRPTLRHLKNWKLAHEHLSERGLYTRGPSRLDLVSSNVEEEL